MTITMEKTQAESRRQIMSSLNPNNLELILLPTEKCNFRCVYCYEDFKLGLMKPEVVSSIKSLIQERVPDLSLLNINWFGGEPLVAPDIVLDLSRFAQSACAEAGTKFTSGCTTNAFLLSIGLLSELVASGITEYQITIDGDQHHHDQTRVLASGGPTYDRIMSNLRAAKASKLAFDITLRLHITRGNIDVIERAYHDLKAEFGPDPRFSFFLKAIENLGGPANAKDAVPLREDVENIAKRASALLAQSERGAGKNGEQYVCYAARPNSFVIRSDGKVAKCTVVFNSDSNKLGQIEPDGRLSLDIDKLRLWMKGFETLDPGSLSCPVDGLKLW